MARAASAALLALAAFAPRAAARIHNLRIVDDPRFVFSIESFGFQDGGRFEIDVHDIAVSPAGAPAVMGFVIYPVLTEAAVNEHVDALVSSGLCALDAPPPGALMINVSEPSTWKDYKASAEVEGTGMFNVLFTRCAPSSADASVTFSLDASFVNPGPNYLSVGDIPLPAIFGVMGTAFAGALFVWVRYLRANKAQVTRVHHMMTFLLVVKVLDLYFECGMYSYIQHTGHNSAWNAMFYIFSFVKGALMAVITLLIGAGWSVLKPFLSDREKKVLLVALVLQVLTNTAIVMTDELAPGSISFIAWVDILHIADFIASAAVVIPIAWSLHTLRQSLGSGGDSDGKAAETLSRLELFRNFYLATIAYVYVTRFLLYILSTTLIYNLTWFVPFADECTTLVYYAVVGFRFRPSEVNAYLKVSGEDDEPESGVATGAAAGVVDGAATAVQTVSARPKAAKAAPGAHAIDDDDDDYGLDEDDLDADEEAVALKGPKMVKKGDGR